ncbi:MAG: ABC transporter ATP-binding protein [Subdoligranulum sp.]|nr:ABC transporter ATP-binding protein [Subdoligranulum sp.]MDD7266130.1 ABC transporter ATP-binding protein [Subdoligranulum sp.]MDY5923379.1 ABC transporter ATP-binding protein [Oscillospiraceae bacterium]
MIAVEHLTKRYGSFTAVDDISFTLEQGHIYGFLGPNGAGKSTTMNMMTGCLAATAGSVTIDGLDIFEQAREAKKLLGYLPEIPPLYPEQTPEEYLRFVAEAKGLPKAQIDAQVAKALAETRLEPMANRLIRHLSKGYRQRVGIAQALLGDPHYIILDEPTVGLDPLQIIEIRDLIHELGQTHTVILSSHILSEVQAICESVLIIAHGKLVAFDTPQNLENRLTSGGRLTLSADCSAEALHRILAAVPAVCDCRLLTAEEGRCKAQLEITGDAAEACRALFFAFAKAETAILQLTPEKADLENIFIELTDAQPDGKEPRHESDL